MSLDTLMDDLIQSLGIPKRIFQGLPVTTSGAYKEMARVEERLKKMRGKFENKILKPLVEENLPDLFWETAWICSPRGRVMRRREVPIQITWDQ